MVPEDKVAGRATLAQAMVTEKPAVKGKVKMQGADMEEAKGGDTLNTPTAWRMFFT